MNSGPLQTWCSKLAGFVYGQTLTEPATSFFFFTFVNLSTDILAASVAYTSYPSKKHLVTAAAAATTIAPS